MNVALLHAESIAEFNKYDEAMILPYFSIAFYNRKDGVELKPFNHSHDDYEFLICLETMPLLLYENTNYIGSAGFCYPANPHVKHGFVFPVNSNFLSIVVCKEYIHNMCNALGISNKIFHDKFFFSSKLVKLVESFKKAYVDEGVEKYSSVHNIANEIVSYLVKQGMNSEIRPTRKEREFNVNIKKALIYINENYRDPELTIAKVANYANYSISYFTKMFKGYMSDTPIMYLNKLKTSDAKAYIIKGEKSLKEISFKSGYKNLSTFTEAFKSVHGITPSKFRKKFFN